MYTREYPCCLREQLIWNWSSLALYECGLRIVGPFGNSREAWNLDFYFYLVLYNKTKGDPGDLSIMPCNMECIIAAGRGCGKKSTKGEFEQCA